MCQVIECRQAVQWAPGCAVCGLPELQLAELAGSHELSRPIRGWDQPSDQSEASIETITDILIENGRVDGMLS